MRNYTACVSARRKSTDISMLHYITQEYPFLTLDQIESVFGFAEFNSMYGGKLWRAIEVTPEDLIWMYDNNIGYRIPLTNLRTTEQDYEDNRPFLEKYHRKGNSIITVHDWMADRIHNDYPEYTVEASVIKNVKTYNEIITALTHFDTLVPGQVCHEDLKLLESLPDKNRIRLFMQIGCALYCNTHICYTAYSRFNRKESTPLLCATNLEKDAPEHHITQFDFNKFLELGFTKFKAHKPEIIRGNNLIP